MEYIAREPFDADFWLFVENFSAVPSYFGRVITFEKFYKSGACQCCGSRGGMLKGKVYHCTSCGLEFCSACMEEENHCVCQFCHILQTNATGLPKSQKVTDWMQKNVALSTCTQIQCAVYFFARLLDNPHGVLHAHGLYALYKYQNVFLKADNIDFLIEFLARHVNQCECDEKALSIDLLCNLILTRGDREVDMRLVYRDIEPMISSRNKNQAVAAAACRLFLVMAQKDLITADQNEVVNSLHTASKEAVAYLTAALAVQCEIPDMYEIHHPEMQEAKYSHMQKMVYGLIKLFDPKCERTSIAAKYFASILIFRVSQSLEGLKLISGYIPSDHLTRTIIEYCPRVHEMEKNKSRIAVFLAAAYLNMWMFSGEKKIKFRSLLFQDIMGFVIPICEVQQGYNEYSYLGILQTLAMELIQACSRDDNCGVAFRSEQFMVMVEKMQRDRELVSEKRIGEYEAWKKQHMDLMNITTQRGDSEFEDVPPMEEEEREEGEEAAPAEGDATSEQQEGQEPAAEEKEENPAEEKEEAPAEEQAVPDENEGEPQENDDEDAPAQEE